MVETVDHTHVVKKVFSDNDWTARYLFMTLMSAGIAVLGLFLSSPAVVIGAMLLSPLMAPIISRCRGSQLSAMALRPGTCQCSEVLSRFSSPTS